MGDRTRLQRVPGPAAPAKPLVAAGVVVLAALGTLTAVTWPGPSVTSTAPQIPGSPAAPTAAEITPVCRTTSPAAVLGPATSLPARPTNTVVTPPGGVVNFAATTAALYVNTGTRLVTYSLAGAQQGSFALPSHFTGNSVSAPVVDPSGNIYLASYYGQLVDKFSPSGALLWSVDPRGGNPTGLFSVGAGASFQVVVSLVQDTAGSLVLDQATGSVTGSFPLVDNGFVTPEADGNLLYSANGYVETVSPSGRVLSTFGSSHIEGNGVHTGSGTQFSYPGQALQGPDGTIYTVDPDHTIEATSPEGFLRGSTSLGSALAIGGGSASLVGSTLYFQSGPTFNNGADAISSVPLSTLQAYLSSAQAPLNSLGWGAGLATAATGNYFAPGATPAVVATFDPWWAPSAPHLRLSYSVEDTASLTAGTVPAPTELPLPTTAAGLASLPLTLPVADTLPGPYQVRATLYDTSTSPPTALGTTCMPYTVGAPGDRLDFAALPAGIGSGGPTDPRGVALNAQLGLDSLRNGTMVDWASLLPGCNASAPTAATCGPTALTFASASTDPYKAAYLADQDHLTYWMQVSGGEPVPTALVNSGLWQADVAALVAHYATVPAGCTACAPVTTWEPWNEANNTGWGNAGTYTAKVLAPFYAAVKSVLPGSSSTVLGGSTLEPSVGWWQQLIAAGGLADMDVASIHPYTGSNDAYEEDGIPAQVRQLQALLGGKPLWFTEVGWWSDGDYNFLGQADDVTRSMIWQKALGVPVQNYFYDEGSWGNNGVSFSLVQAGQSVDYVKPAALATMTTSGLLAGRPYLSMPSIGIPQAYRADFGTTPGGTTDVSAVWTDGLPVTASLTLTDPSGAAVPVTATTEYGGVTTAQAVSGTAYGLPLSGQVTFLTYPAGDTLTVGPTEGYGTDLASAAAGATADASSGNASAAIAGLPAGYGQGWTSGPGDSTPSLTVTLAAPSTIDRVVVDTQSVGSTAPGLRNYTVSADEPGTGWVTLADERGQFRDHQLQFAFDPVSVSAVRISVTELDYGGYYGGGIPPFWPATQSAAAFVHALEAYAGSGGPAVVDGSGLPTLAWSDPGGGTAGGTSTTPPPGGTAPPTSGSPAPGPGDGYRMVTSAAQVSAFGGDPSYGPDGAHSLNRPIVGMADTPDRRGYWLVGSDGGIFNFGDAGFFGSTGALGLNAPIVGMASTADGAGYWLVGADGGIFATGDAPYLGSTGALTLNRPIVGMAATPDGRGYWLVASDGGIFAFGDAPYLGSTGALTLNRPIGGMAATPDGRGYWLVASDGGIFTFGDASFAGSAAG
ncbi:MAG TPA: discoidin domain-containing protein [Acidimicrobiales bacterium]|nr:discoidin domain-containing protein [Acidimicrobiales bacterium]